MHFRLVLFAVLAFAFAGNTACNDDKNDNKKTSTSAEKQLAVALCQDLFECPSAYLGFYPFDNEDMCVEFLQAHAWEDLFYQAVRIDAATVDQCVDAIKDRCFAYSAFEELPEIPECMGLFDVGPDVGTQCMFNEDCASGYCDINHSDRPACGTCSTPPSALGETCGRYSGECPRYSSDGKPIGCRYDGALEDYTCQYLAPYKVAQKGESCVYDSYDYGPSPTACAIGLYCNEDNTCAEGAAVGEACASYRDPCVPGAYCHVEETESYTGTCKEMVLATTPGAECDPYWEMGVECSLAEGLFCHFTLETCVELGGVYKYCLMDSDCSTDEFCGYESSQCHPLLEDGEACDWEVEQSACKSGFCDYANGDAEITTCLPVDICGE